MKVIALFVGIASAINIRSLSTACSEANVQGVSCRPHDQMLFADGVDEDGEVIDVSKDGNIMMYKKEVEHNISPNTMA